LRISTLAKEFGVSMTPVREAIFHLVSDHALDMKAATSIYVPVLTANQLREIQLIRHSLEGEAAGMAAQRITKPELAETRSHPLAHPGLLVEIKCVAVRQTCKK
jgi:DNA-binding GntR family transcriptional regulator